MLTSPRPRPGTCGARCASATCWRAVSSTMAGQRTRSPSPPGSGGAATQRVNGPLTILGWSAKRLTGAAAASSPGPRVGFSAWSCAGRGPMQTGSATPLRPS
eukprot:12124660-Alexandrium_andersonii.AAC.1